MLRRFIKTGIAGALHRSGADRWVARLCQRRNAPLIICYHRVIEDLRSQVAAALPGMLTSRTMLERHLDWIGRRYRFAHLDEIGDRLQSGVGFREPVASVTFDDGYRDSYEQAFPLLKRKGIPAAIFVVTDSIGTARGQLADILYLLIRRAFSKSPAAPRDLARLALEIEGMPLPQLETTGNVAWKAMRILIDTLPQASLWRFVDALDARFGDTNSDREALRPMSWEMVSEMHRAGVVIGSHTRTHPLLPKESRPKVLEETSGSRDELQTRLGAPIRHFAYPNGWFNSDTVRAVAVSGYRFAYTTCRHRDPVSPLLTIQRRCLWENSCVDAAGRFSGDLLSSHVHGILDLVSRCRQNHGDPALDRPLSHA